MAPQVLSTLDGRRDARVRAEWLMELADVQQLSIERLGTRYFDWERLSDSALEAAEIFAAIESPREHAAA